MSLKRCDLFDSPCWCNLTKTSNPTAEPNICGNASRRFKKPQPQPQQDRHVAAFYRAKLSNLCVRQ